MKRFWTGDRGVWGAGLGLSLISLIALRSAAATLNPALAIQQAVWVGVGFAACVAMSSCSYRRWFDLVLVGHGVAMALLVVVLVAGTVKLGAERWLQLGPLSVQPSELAKVTTVCALARLLSGQPAPLSLQRVLLSGIAAGVPALLIFVQPDLGTSTIFLAVWAGTVWAAGLSRRHLIVIGTAAMAVLPVGWHLLKEYQRMRLMVFVNPQIDPLGAGYTIIQSKIALGSGQLLGRGWMAGTQNQLNFLPERHADFLFSVIGEEWGWLGGLLVIGLFALLCWRAAAIALQASDPQGRLVAIGVMSWIAYQAIVNLGMVMGLLPVVGIPLPLVSYGGSAMVTTWMALGLLHSVRRFN